MDKDRKRERVREKKKILDKGREMFEWKTFQTEKCETLCQEMEQSKIENVANILSGDEQIKLENITATLSYK